MSLTSKHRGSANIHKSSVSSASTQTHKHLHLSLVSDGGAANEAALINALGTNEVQTAGEIERKSMK